MDDFDHFVKGLGPHAKRYTQEQLKQLHVDVAKFARLLLEAYRTKMAAKQRGSPQPDLDLSDDDRNIESVLIEPVDGPDPP